LTSKAKWHSEFTASKDLTPFYQHHRYRSVHYSKASSVLWR
jgi:hypothetical protein